MKSMTGYGRGECAQDGFKVTAELSAVNRKQSELAVYVPRELEPLESRIRDEVNRRVARGRLTVRVGLHAAEGQRAAHVRLNTALAKGYVRELRKLAKTLRVEPTVTLDMIARAPGVMQTDADIADASDFWPAVHKALHQALVLMIQMREREGEHLAKDLCARIATLRRAADRVTKQAPRVAKRFQEQLRSRLHQAGEGAVAMDDARLLQEVVLFADRSDISEELTRLQSHFQQFEDCLKSKEPVGRTLDFLAQEMNREINTIGSKANDSVISRDVVILKAELERFREQVQNVE